MEEKLNSAWGDFSSVMAERGARLSVALMFHRSAEKVSDQYLVNPCKLSTLSSKLMIGIKKFVKIFF